MTMTSVLDPQQAAASADPMSPLPFRIAEVIEEIPGCSTLIVEPETEDGKALCSFRPGQFHMLYSFGTGEVPISISGDPEDSSRLVFTIMGVGAASRALAGLKAGTIIGVRGAYGSVWPTEIAKGRDVMIVAGGLGLAPLRPSIYTVLNHRSDYGRAILLYGSRQPESLLYPEQLEEWNSEGGFEVGVTVDAGNDGWEGNVGLVTELIKASDFAPEKTVAMVCGPEPMMKFSAYALMEKGMVAKDIYVSMERNMKCAIGQCGRCQYGPYFTCRDGAVFSFDVVEQLFKTREV